MAYQIFISKKARSDIFSAYTYISVTLQNQKAADDLTDEITEVAGSLIEYPERFSLVNDPVLRSWGIRTAKAKKYTIFYTVNKKERRVYIVRFLYSKRNWASLIISSDKLESE